MNISVISFILLLFSITSLDATTHEFWEQKDEIKEPNKWQIQKSKSDITITGQTANGLITIITDPNYHTKEWRLEQPDKDRIVTAERRGNQVYINSQEGRQKETKVIEIDDKPWMQAPGLQLNPFIKSDQSKQKIWTITNETLKAHEMQFKKLNQDTKKIEVLMSPVGFGSFLWRGFLWFDRNDGYFLRYSGPSGGLNSPKTESYRIPVGR